MSGPVLIDGTAPSAAHFPSGACKITGGPYVVVWMRDDGVQAKVFAVETTDLLDDGAYGSTVELTTTLPGFDPSVNQLEDSSVVATWNSGDAVMAAKRLGPGSWTAPAKIYSTHRPDLHVKEQCAQAIGSRVLTSINEMGPTQFDHPATVRYFELLESGGSPTAGTPQTITINGTGNGTEGFQRRVALARGKRSNQIIAAFSRDANGGPRPIAICRSINSGSTWKDLGDLLRWHRNDQDYDLVNPIGVWRSRSDVRFYFAVHQYGLGMSSTHDGGCTWDPISLVDFDTNAYETGHLFVFKDAGGRLVAFAAGAGFDSIWAVELTP